MFLHMCYKRCGSDVMDCSALIIKCFKSSVESVNGFSGVFLVFAMCRIFYGSAVRPFLLTFMWCIKCEFI